VTDPQPGPQATSEALQSSQSAAPDTETSADAQVGDSESAPDSTKPDDHG
jgi:hypothetical protein